MDKLKREQFFKKIGLLAAGYLLVPGISSARSFLPEVCKDFQSGLGNSVKDDMHDGAIIDLHCHPSLKMYLLGKKMWKAHLLKNPGPNLIHMQDDTKDLGAGNVKGMVATHYLPEIGIRKNWHTVAFLWPAIRYLLFSTSEKVEHGDYSNFTQINTMMDTLEYQLYIVNEKFAAKKEPNFKYVIARDFAEFEKALDPANKPRTIPVAHAIEGSHALGRNFYPVVQATQAHVSKSTMSAKQPHEGKMHNNNDDNPDFYIMNLRALKERGVCMMTLGHFFENDLVYPVDGVSPDSKKVAGMNWNYDPVKDNLPLKKVGRDVVREMLRIGVIVDITHTTPKTRDEVFEINRHHNEQRVKEGKTPRPLVFSHVGAQHIFDKYDTVPQYQHYGYYNVRDEDIAGISDCDGVMGVIPENFWLVGADTHMKKDGFNPDDFKKGIKYIIETIVYINSKTEHQDFRNIGIGTDFDGLADNPADLYKASQLDVLIAEIRAIPGITEPQVNSITSGNALRLLRNGWSE